MVGMLTISAADSVLLSVRDPLLFLRRDYKCHTARIASERLLRAGDEGLRRSRRPKRFIWSITRTLTKFAAKLPRLGRSSQVSRFWLIWSMVHDAGLSLIMKISRKVLVSNVNLVIMVVSSAFLERLSSRSASSLLSFALTLV